MSDSTLDILPAGKTAVSIKTHGFPGGVLMPGEFEFNVDCRKAPFELTIPGVRGGHDNCAPYFVEQERWLDELARDGENGIQRIWDCLWYIESETALRMFLRRLEPFRIETQYY